jgi:DtxR family Mn-dependent transcriptional regulator
MRADNHISSTLEDYLEAILVLTERTGAARVRDIASELSVHKSTVTAALKNRSV